MHLTGPGTPSIVHDAVLVHCLFETLQSMLINTVSSKGFQIG